MAGAAMAGMLGSVRIIRILLETVLHHGTWLEVRPCTITSSSSVAVSPRHALDTAVCSVLEASTLPTSPTTTCRRRSPSRLSFARSPSVVGPTGRVRSGWLWCILLVLVLVLRLCVVPSMPRAAEQRWQSCFSLRPFAKATYLRTTATATATPCTSTQHHHKSSSPSCEQVPPPTKLHLATCPGCRRPAYRAALSYIYLHRPGLSLFRLAAKYIWTSKSSWPGRLDPVRRRVRVDVPFCALQHADLRNTIDEAELTAV